MVESWSRDLMLVSDWCREALVCGANDTLPEQSQESVDSGFSCNWVDTEEFVTIDCNCTVQHMSPLQSILLNDDDAMQCDLPGPRPGGGGGGGVPAVPQGRDLAGPQHLAAVRGAAAL